MLNSIEELRFKVPLTLDLRNIAIILFFSRTAIVDLISIVGIPKPLLAVVISIVTYIFLFFCLVFYKKTLCLDGLLLIVFCIVFFKHTLIQHPEYYSVYFDERFNIYTTVFNGFTMMFAYYFIRMQTNYLNLIESFKYVAVLNFIGTFWQLFQKSGSDYGMRFGYTLSLSAIIFLYFYFKDRNMKYLSFSIISIFLAVVGGSRGTILGYCIFIVSYIIFTKKKKLSYTDIFTFLSITIIGVLSLSKDFLRAIYNMFSTLGFESRTLLMFIEGRALEQNGRDAIHYKIQQQIDQLGWFDYLGSYSDRFVLRGRFYAHNIVMESTLTFGKFATLLLVLCIIASFVYLTIKYRDTDLYGLLLIFGSFSFSRLWVSSSFWIEPMLGAYLALVIAMILWRKEDKI